MNYANWRFINSGYADAFTNMAIDEAIMLNYRKGLTPPTLRLYGWNPSAVSIGYFQKLEETVDIEACKRLGVDVVRRPTGGRAVLHEHEVTYSVVIGEDYPGMPSTVVESYKFICKGIIEGLGFLGINVSMESGKNKDKALNSTACFDSASMYEILYEGKKLVGSAQVRKNGVILQHGSILLDIDINKLTAVLKFKSGKSKDKVNAALRGNVTTLHEIVNGKIESKMVAEGIVKGFEKAFEARLLEQEVLPAEKELAEKLVQRYYLY